MKFLIIMTLVVQENNFVLQELWRLGGGGGGGGGEKVVSGSTEFCTFSSC